MLDYLISTRNVMRYPTCGDYFKVGRRTFIDIMEQDEEDYEFLIMIHELIEEYLTRKRGIAEQDITIFDMVFEREREEGLHGEDDEPGYDMRAPYRKEHIFSENIERLIAQELGVDWNEYTKRLKS
jgi:hypothetical protein